ncbi:uncharacterized protein Dwil_GK24509 [Drosophila willistoni]|uniref:Uncharacterized protein n=1 Tax=Drosophila willistoni TaxID=7260 RepID=B4N0B1_DROWI|nr:uncharacterized protein LOC6644062 isoform X1 [Drosophila willistoni]EDW77524.2 uncharacterized protein Dwil_GK24509 [Drosophila willistoni]
MDSRKSQVSEHRASEILKQKELIDANMARFYETIGNVSRNLRKSDWSYLHQHPEVRAIIRVIITEAISHNPKNIFHFAAELFDCNNNQSLVAKINKQLKWIDEQLIGASYSPVDGEMLFSESSDISVTDRKPECADGFKRVDPVNVDNAEKTCVEPKVTICPENLKPSCL